MSFGFNCSQGALKSIAVSSSGLYLSCGGTDERIRLFNVAENRSMGELGLHEGAITALEFFEDSHMISGSDVRPLKLLYSDYPRLNMDLHVILIVLKSPI